MGLLKKKLIVALIDKNGKVLKKPVHCYKCDKTVSLINYKIAHCGRCGSLDVIDLAEALGVKRDLEPTFIETY